MNRERRRHPEKQSPPRPLHEKEILDKSPSDHEQTARAKSWGHKKVTADKWNQ